MQSIYDQTSIGRNKISPLFSGTFHVSFTIEELA